MARPMAIQPAEIPDRYAAPGRPISSQPDMSDACALRPVTHEPSCRPPRKYSFVVRFLPTKYMPMQSIKIR